MKKNNNSLKLIFIGAVSGIVNGLFGTGGGIILISFLPKIEKMDSKKVHATTLAAVLFMCLPSLFLYLSKNKVDFQLFWICLIGLIVGSIIGFFLLKKLKNIIIDFIFSIFLIATGVIMIL